MDDDLRQELDGLAEAWLDDACKHREPSDPISDAVSGTYQECAEEIKALLNRRKADGSPSAEVLARECSAAVAGTVNPK